MQPQQRGAGGSSGLRRAGLLVTVAALSLLPSGLLISRWHQHAAGAVSPPAPAPMGLPEELEPAAEPPPAAASEAAAAAAAAPMAAAAAAGQQPRTEAAPGHVNIALATDEEEPIGLLAVVNSTLAHSRTPRRVRFHLIVPAERRKPLREALERLWPQTSFHMYSLDGGGVRSKIQHHLHKREKEAIFVSPFRFAVAYLPQLLPSVKRVLWLHTDVLVRGDVGALYNTRLRGAPLAAAEDCSHTLRDVLNTSHVAVAAAVAPGACVFNTGVLLVDLQQWSLLDLSSRVEYWMDVNLRTATLYPPHAPLPPLLLAALPLYAKLPQRSNVAGLGRRKLSADEVSYWRAYWAARGRSYAPGAGGAPHLVLLEPDGGGGGGGGSGGGGSGGGSGVANGSHAAVEEGTTVLHYSGKFKPWFGLTGAAGGGKRAAPVVAECEDATITAAAGGGGGGGGARQPCDRIWEPYASRALAAMGWARPDAAAATARAAAAAALSAGTDASEAAPVAALAQEARDEVASGTVHVTLVSQGEAPYGLFAAINSTLSHCAAAAEGRARLQFVVITTAAEPTRQRLLLTQLRRAFGDVLPPEQLSVVGAPLERLARLSARLAPLGVSTAPAAMPLLWLAQALPSEVTRTLLLSTDTLVLTDVLELWGVALGGKAAAAVEDCSVLYETYFNYHHGLFKQQARSACAFDGGTLLLDLRAWRREELSTRLLELVGLSRRTEGLYTSPSYAAATAVPLLLALGKRVLKLPARWMARGLGRECRSYGEMGYWQRFWGQQAITVPLAQAPVRAPHAVLRPSREAGDARLVRFGGGAIKPWLRRCSSSAAPALCGRPPQDCAKLFWKQLDPKLIPLIQATPDDGASGGLRVPPKPQQRPCVPAPRTVSTLTCLPEGGAAPEPLANLSSADIVDVFTDEVTGKKMVRRKVRRMVPTGGSAGGGGGGGGDTRGSKRSAAISV